MLPISPGSRDWFADYEASLIHITGPNAFLLPYLPGLSQLAYADYDTLSHPHHWPQRLLAPHLPGSRDWLPRFDLSSTSLMPALSSPISAAIATVYSDYDTLSHPHHCPNAFMLPISAGSRYQFSRITTLSLIHITAPTPSCSPSPPALATGYRIRRSLITGPNAFMLPSPPALATGLRGLRHSIISHHWPQGLHAPISTGARDCLRGLDTLIYITGPNAFMLRISAGARYRLRGLDMSFLQRLLRIAVDERLN